MFLLILPCLFQPFNGVFGCTSQQCGGAVFCSGNALKFTACGCLVHYRTCYHLCYIHIPKTHKQFTYLYFTFAARGISSLQFCYYRGEEPSLSTNVDIFNDIDRPSKSPLSRKEKIACEFQKYRGKINVDAK